MQKPIALDCLDLFPMLDIDVVNERLYKPFKCALKSNVKLRIYRNLLLNEYKLSNVISGAI